jgi:hypothetical protein
LLASKEQKAEIRDLLIQGPSLERDSIDKNEPTSKDY